MIRAVIFDLGHTIWDITHGDPVLLSRAYAEFHARLRERLPGQDLPPPEDIREAVRTALQASLETYFDSNERLDQPPAYSWVDEGCRALGLTLDETLLRELTPPLFQTEIDNLVCADGTVEALHGLARGGYRLGCITNTLSNGAGIRAMLRRYEIEDLMSSVVVSEDEGWRKPHRSLFEKALRQLDVVPHEAVFVGDSPFHDIGGAKAAGMYAVLTRQYAARPYEGFEPAPDAIIRHLSELQSVIEALDAQSATSAK
jgi:putative hydrolase of the HAD superfamily